LSIALFNACFAATEAEAQDMRVYTSVTDISQSEDTSPVISSSLTLFHAGKVYDYMENVGEVVIFEPAQHRFIILGKNYTATEVPFTEIHQFLESAEAQAIDYIAELNSHESTGAVRTAAVVKFQLDPNFQESFEPESLKLSLRGGHLNYLVTGSKVEHPSAVENYLNYADWASRLNYVLHPHSAFPDARLMVNKSLREKKVLPVQVELSMQLDPPVKLRAEHSYAWKFQSIDRRHISHWEQTLRSDKVRWVSFREYQQQLLVKNH